MLSLYCADVSFAIVMLRLAYAMICSNVGIVRLNNVMICLADVIVHFISEVFCSHHVSMPTIHTSVRIADANVPTVGAKLRN